MVAMNVWPTDAADGSVANEARWRKMGRLWTPSAVASGIGLEMAPSLAGTNLTIRNGACWVDGHYCELLADQVLTTTANGLAVVRFDPVANTADLLYRDAATGPTQSPTGTWELPIAAIVASALVDTRPIARPTTGVWFPTMAARDETWNTPADGATCYTADNGYQWVRRAGAWVVLPAGFLGTASGPSSQTDVLNGTVTTLVTLTVNVVAGFRYRVNAYGSGTVISGAGVNQMMQIGTLPGVGVTRFIQAYGIPINNVIAAAGLRAFTAAATGPLAVLYQASSTGTTTAIRFAANACDLSIEHIG